MSALGLRLELSVRAAELGVLHKIRTNFDYPPIPVRNMDWSATTEDFDADWDGEKYISSHPVGRGTTEDAAIEDLLDQIEERQ